MREDLKFQRHLFQLIQEKEGAKNLVKKIANTLNLSPSAVYKRVNGSRVISLEEALKLIAYFDIPTHLIFQGDLATLPSKNTISKAS